MNAWIVLAVAIWFAAMLLAVIAYVRATGGPHRFSMNILVLGTGLAVFLSQLPAALATTGGGVAGTVHAVAVSIYYSLQTFTSGSDTGALLQLLGSDQAPATQFGAVAVGLMHLSAPLLLITAVVSYFQTPTSMVKYAVRFTRNTNIFSELNEQSLALAESLKKHEPRSAIVFTNVIIAANTPSAELIARARALGGICFKKDLLSLPLFLRSRNAHIRMFIIGSDEAANAWYAVDVLASRRYARRESTDLYAFSTTVEADLALAYRGNDLKIRVRRVNPARAMVYDWLWRDGGADQTAGADIFANVLNPGEAPIISAAVVGLGAHGSEMLRALTWYCRMELPDHSRVRLRLNAFDHDPHAEQRLRATYPGLLNSSITSALHADTDVVVHNGVDATTATLSDVLRREELLDFVFISLGDDARNIRVAVELFRDCVRLGRSPQILALSRNSARLSPALRRMTEEAGRRVGHGPLPSLHLVGETAEVFSYEAVIQSDMELNGLVCHLAWADLEHNSLNDAIESFWASEYNYSSSLAVPIHWKARRAVGTPGARLAVAERTPEEHARLIRLEHDRWCSFMLSEGFVHGDFKSAYLIRTHPLLVCFDDLEAGEAVKDDNDSRDTLPKLEQTPSWKEASASPDYRPLIERMRAAVAEASLTSEAAQRGC